MSRLSSDGRIASAALGAAMLAVPLSAGGCNAITGAADLVIGGGPAAAHDPGQGGAGAASSSGSGAGSSSSGSGASSGSSSGTGGSSSSSGSSSGTGGSSSSSGTGGSGGAPPPPPPPVGDAADGVTITAVDLYQAVRVPLMGQSDVPIVAGKDAMVRVFYQADGGYDGQPVTARFTAGQYYAEASGTLGGASTQPSLSSTLNIEVPGYMITVGGSYRVDLVQPNGPGSNSGAGYPPGTQQISLGAQSTGSKLKVMLVPVDNNGSLPDTSPGQVQKYADWIGWQYPIPEVEVTVRSQPYAFNGYLGGYNGWSQLLDALTDLRASDNAPADQYYYGIHDANGNGLLGLGWIGGPDDVWSRTAIGVGWTGDTAPETAVHEIGHNHGREHAPCGVSGDMNFPYPGASIGEWGYHPVDHALLDPNDYVDFMSYCSPTWVSDYTYKALFTRLKHVNGAKIIVPPELLDRSYDRIRVLDGQAGWGNVIQLPTPAVGVAVPVTVTTALSTEQRTGHYYAYNHLQGGVLYLMRPLNPNPLNLAQTVSFTVEGQGFALSR